jgi:hypothetical protein
MIGFGSFGALFIQGAASVFIKDEILKEHFQFVLIEVLYVINGRVISVVIVQELLGLSVLNRVFEFKESYILLDLFAIVLPHGKLEIRN